MLYLFAFLLEQPIPVRPQAGSIDWLAITQSVIALLLLGVVKGIGKLSKIGVDYVTGNSARLEHVERVTEALDRARLRHRREIDHVGSFLEETHPGKFRRRATDFDDEEGT